MSEASLLFSVVVPSRGEEAKLLTLLEALARQSLPHERFEVIVALDGADAAPAVDAKLEALGGRADVAPAVAARPEVLQVRIVTLERRAGPGAARNRGAALARGTFLAFTEDDVTPEADWLQRAAERLEREPALDVLEGLTVKPGGRPVHRQAQDQPLFLPTNLFVRRAVFEAAGGYDERFFDAKSGVYFREDADLGFTLEDRGARVAREPGAVVTHPEEHARFLDPLRWARRHEMDPLLAAKHPALFRTRVEVHRLGPLRVRRPIVRASVGCVLAVGVALVAAVAGARGAVVPLLAVAGAAFLPVWAKWRFSPLRLPVVLLVPFALTLALVRGRVRVQRLLSGRLPTT
ncbi:MAG: glycosyltransferase family 2 protein [Candidatus Eisenbacteria bacterium]|nr:glycosyltransferase family 2 protein [Candidatus Eisenbacteria bacterium]